jgi:hypothetical protein
LEGERKEEEEKGELKGKNCNTCRNKVKSNIVIFWWKIGSSFWLCESASLKKKNYYFFPQII